MIAFQRFKEIEKLETAAQKHKAWLEDYEGLYYSIALNSVDLIKWQQSKEKYIYKKENFSTEINKIERHPRRLVIEFDDTNASANIEIVKKKLEEMKYGYIESTHKGKSNYLWIEFTKKISDAKAKQFLAWVCPENAEVDMNFASSKGRLPVLFATHWKHSNEREIPIKFFEGNQISIDSLPTTEKILNIKNKNGYFTYKKIEKIIFSYYGKKDLAGQILKIQPFYYDEGRNWWVWNRNYWKITDETDILNLISTLSTANTIKSSEKAEILEALRQESRINKPKKIKPTWIQFKNHFFDVSTGEKIEVSSEYFATNPIPWDLHPENFMTTPTFDKIFEEWVGKENILTLYQILAYCMLPDYPVHRLFCLIGEGMNGKTCFLRILTKLLGLENVCATELDTLLESRFEVTRLYKKLACIMGETNFSELSKTSLLKKLTGQDVIGFEYKNKNPFEDKNYAKIIIATNNLPETTDKTIGYYRRWLIIDFPNRFSEEQDILSTIPEEEYQSLALRCVEMLSDLLKERRFHNEGSIEDRQKRYEDKSNPFDKFWKENINAENPNVHIWKFEFEKRFSDWCRINRFREFSEKLIAMKMKEKGVQQQKLYADWIKDGKGGHLRAWTGIQWV